MDVVTFIKDVGKHAAEAYDMPKIISEKATYADIVTESDQAIENYIISEIKAKYPDHNIVGEESATGHIDFTDKPTWFIDPIDGTSNFASTPPANLFFEAFSGQGAFLNGKRIKVNQKKVLTDWGGDRSEENIKIKAFNMMSVVQKFRGIRTLGSAALHACQIASGNGDIFFEFGIHCWDYAAGVLIASEAGAYCCSIDGGSVDLMARHVIVSSNRDLAEDLLKIIKPINYDRD